MRLYPYLFLFLKQMFILNLWGLLIATVDISEINQIIRKPFKTTESDQSFLINSEELIILKSRSDEE